MGEPVCLQRVSEEKVSSLHSSISFIREEKNEICFLTHSEKEELEEVKEVLVL